MCSQCRTATSNIPKRFPLRVYNLFHTYAYIGSKEEEEQKTPHQFREPILPKASALLFYLRQQLGKCHTIVKYSFYWIHFTSWSSTNFRFYILIYNLILLARECMLFLSWQSIIYCIKICLSEMIANPFSTNPIEFHHHSALWVNIHEFDICDQ